MSNNTISLEEAKKHVHNWRGYYADVYNAFPNEENKSITKIKPNDPSVFRGFFVKLKDLMGVKDILEAYLKLNNNGPVDEDKIGIRVYLAKNTDYVSDQKNMHVLIVPVVEGKDILNFTITVNDDKQSAEKASTGSISSSTIFDFSSPCPATCDTTSALY